MVGKICFTYYILFGARQYRRRGRNSQGPLSLSVWYFILLVNTHTHAVIIEIIHRFRRIHVLYGRYYNGHRKEIIRPESYCVLCIITILLHHKTVITDNYHKTINFKVPENNKTPNAPSLVLITPPLRIVSKHVRCPLFAVFGWPPETKYIILWKLGVKRVIIHYNLCKLACYYYTIRCCRRFCDTIW